MCKCSLKPSTQKVLALASEVKILQKEKDHLRNNLTTAEEEVKVLDEENSLLEKENRRLMKLLHKERHLNDSGGKQNSASLKVRNTLELLNSFLCLNNIRSILFGENQTLYKHFNKLKDNLI